MEHMESCVVVEYGTSNILFYSDLESCRYFLDTYPEDKDLVILYGDEDIPEDWK